MRMRKLKVIVIFGFIAALMSTMSSCDSTTENPNTSAPDVVTSPDPRPPGLGPSKMSGEVVAMEMKSPMSMSDGNMEGMQHSHAPIGVPDGVAEPGLSLTLYKDTQDGYNLQLISRAFKLGPPPRRVLSMEESMQATTDSDTGFLEGHAHLYINGEKIQRIYGSDVHIPEHLIPVGTNQITVTLNNHGHMYWIINGKQVLATLFVNPESQPIIANRFESFPAK